MERALTLATLALIVLMMMGFTNVLDFMIMMPMGPQLMRHFRPGPTDFPFPN